MTRRFALGFGLGLALLCASLASLEHLAPTGAAEYLAPPREGEQERAQTPARPPAHAQASTPGDTHPSVHARARARAPAGPQANPEEWEDAREAEVSPGTANPPAPVTRALELHPAASAGGAVRFVGFDPGAPRALWLWRIRKERAAVVALARSEPDGTFAFSPLRVPAAGLEVVATPSRVKPGEAEASRVRKLGPRSPRAPHGEARDDGHGAWHVQVTPAEATGSVLVGNANEQVIGRFALPRLPGALPRALDLNVLPDAGDDSLWLAHELTDGRRSAWRPVTWDEDPTWDEDTEWEWELEEGERR
jgi:hypothetical protein